MKRLVCACLILLMLCACVPTPEEEAVVAPSGYEAAIRDRQNQTEQRETVLSSAHWDEVLKLRYWDITIDADVSPNMTGTAPVYESAFVHMDDIQVQADKVKRGLLKNATAYSESTFTKADYYRQIQMFADTPVWDDETGDCTKYPTDEEVRTYTKDLSSFIDAAPVELEYHPFSPETDPIPEDARYTLSDGTQARMHCGAGDVYIYYGTELFFNAVDQSESQVLEGGALPGEPVGTTVEGVKIDAETAEEQALSLMTELSLDGFKIAKTEKARYADEYTHRNLTVGYRVVLCRAEGAYETAGDTISRRLYNRENPSKSAAYRPDWFQEWIWIFVDETGVRSFWWSNPTAKPRLVNEAVEILPFDRVQDIIRTHLKNCFSFEENEELFREWYAGRSKYLVDHVGLYFGIIPKENDVDAFYYGPVWIVTVLGYPADADVPALPYTMPVQYLHINAIDGSLINYHA